MRRWVAIVSAVALAVPTATAAAAIPAGAAGVSPGITPAAVTAPAGMPVPNAPACRRVLQDLRLFRTTSKFVYPSQLTLLDQTASIDLATFKIIDPVFTDPSRVLWYRSLMWAAWTAALMKERGQSVEATIMARETLRAVRAHPDPGSATPAALAKAFRIGWDEGTAMRRAQALMCLASVTGKDAVEGPLRAHASALVDPRRYAGPPARRVHNHGMMANQTLIYIAQMLKDPAYARVALNRLRNDATQVFSPKGFSYEGSSHYHTVNHDGWDKIRQELLERGYPVDAAVLQAVLDRAADTAAHMISPTGVAMLLGNSRPEDGYLRPTPSASRPLLIEDRRGGALWGRWSWTKPTTTAWTAMNRLRGETGHSHDDRTALTWQTSRLPILIDVGQPDYEGANPFTVWSRKAPAHNVSVPSRKGTDTARVRKLKVKRSGATDLITLANSRSGALQTREAIVDDKRKSLFVTDHVASTQSQHWHLASQWTVESVSGNRAVLADPSGARLSVVTNGSISAFRGSRSPMAGWVTVAFERVSPAVELVITGSSVINTHFSLKGPLPVGPRVDGSSEVGSRRVNLSWEAAEGLKVRGYRIQMREGTGPWRTVVVDTGSTETERTIRRLRNGERYRFRVAALANRKLSEFGPDSRRFIPFGRPGQVHNVRAELQPPAKDQNVVVSWDPPADNGGDRVTSYEVKARGEGWSEVSVPRVTVKLEQDHGSVKIRAVNSAGAGAVLRVRLTIEGDVVVIS